MHTYTLQQGDLLAKVAKAGHQNPVIHGYKSDDADGVEQGQGGCRNLDLAKQLPVHLCPLLYKKTAHLQQFR